jgi:outer membrane biosynthesis protein TonB
MIWIKLLLVVVWFIAGVILFAKEVSIEFPVLKPYFEKLGILGEKTVKPTNSPNVNPTAAPVAKTPVSPVVKPIENQPAKPTSAPVTKTPVSPVVKPIEKPTAAPTTNSTPKPVTKPKVKTTEKPKTIKSDSPAKK